MHRNSLGVWSRHVTYPMCPRAVEVCSVKCGGSLAWHRAGMYRPDMTEVQSRFENATWNAYLFLTEPENEPKHAQKTISCEFRYDQTTRTLRMCKVS